MKYSEIKLCDIANGVGVRTSLFVSGCRNKCQECFNPETWDFNHGEQFTQETIDYILKTLEEHYIDGLSILGGEPLEPENQSAILTLVRQTKAAYPDKKIWMWTGFTWFDILNNPNCRACTAITRLILHDVDILVDGPFEISNKDITLRFRGSSNQRLIDVRESLKQNKVVIWHDDPIFETHSMED